MRLFLLVIIAAVFSGRPLPPRQLAFPAALCNLSATTVSKAQINLSWPDNTDNETGFRIERSKRVNTAFTEIATVRRDLTSCSDTITKKNTPYYYLFRAANAYGDSPYSNEASAQISE
jgi:hypothetical protein